MKRVLYFVMIFVLINSGTVWAGDPWRYSDRATWPDWAAEWAYTDTAKLYPRDGELVDAIRFELIRGYPVTPQDYMKYEDREFRPNQPISRAEFAAVLGRSQALANADGAGAEWFVPYVVALKEHGVIPGGSSEDWGAPISRREAAQWMGRAADAFGADEIPGGPVFVDVDDLLILRALRAGIVKGVGEGRFEPDRSLLRVEAAVMLLRLTRARNSQIEPATVGTMQEVIKEADRQATERAKRWIDLGYIDSVETGGVLTEEFAEYLKYHARDSVEVRQMPPSSWSVTPAETYQFRVIELHDTIATLGLCATGLVYRAGDPIDQPWQEIRYCGRQYLVLQGDRWLVSAAADPEDTGPPPQGRD